MNSAPSENKIPACVGIIMDGNRRHAKELGLPGTEGHLLGYRKAKEVVAWCKEAGIANVILYAFSTENWARSPEEVGYLTDILTVKLLADIGEFRKEGEAVRFIGDVGRFGAKFAQEARQLEAENPQEPSATVAIAVSYGGRAEILAAVNGIIASGRREPITEGEFEARLLTAGIPDPDLIIRTGGELRLSNFLPWQGVYSELFFTPTRWPAFAKEEFSEIVRSYGERQRRRGR